MTQVLDVTGRDLVSFPKSGRSWVRFALVHAGVADQIRFHHDGFEYNDGGLPPFDFDMERRLARYRTVDRVVYLDRDPRDVIVSLYFQVTGRFKDFFKYTGSLSEFIRHPYFGAQNLGEFQRQWTALCRQGVALQISYEDCHRDLEAVLRSVLAYYGLHVEAEALRRACQAASFDNMKQVEESGSFAEPWLRLRNGAPKVRRGVVGGFRAMLSEDDIAFLNATFDIPSQLPVRCIA